MYPEIIQREAEKCSYSEYYASECALETDNVNFDEFLCLKFDISSKEHMRNGKLLTQSVTV